MRELLTGNEAVARGAFEAGITFAAGYPGTPATEIIEEIQRFPEVTACWAANEKVALEMASGASFAGQRSIVVMKHVGLNVAADPLMTLAYTGVRGGIVIAVADDPGMVSSQNEQDSRLYGRMAQIPVLEPSDSAEALVFTKEAFGISERFDIPVMVRLTTAISHSASPVETDGRRSLRNIEPFKEPSKYVMLPPFCNQRRLDLISRFGNLQRYSEEFPLTVAELRSAEVGVVTAGVSYHYVREAFPDASVLKIAMTNPLPLGLVRRFSEGLENLHVVEELGPVMEHTIRAAGIRVSTGGMRLPRTGELSVRTLQDSLAGRVEGGQEMREPSIGAFCPGCFYLSVFMVLRNSGLFVFGDIGCYTLAARTFKGSIDTTLCMGAGISQAAGFLRARPGDKAVAIIGDSTFFHSGIPALINAAYHELPVTVVILDNGSTAMTGGQPHAGMRVDMKALLLASGIRHIEEIDSPSPTVFEESLRLAVTSGKPSVIITRGRCVIHNRPNPRSVNGDLCDACGECLAIGCPPLSVQGGTVHIGRTCVGCNLCSSLCKRGAIE